MHKTTDLVHMSTIIWKIINYYMIVFSYIFVYIYITFNFQKLYEERNEKKIKKIHTVTLLLLSLCLIVACSLKSDASEPLSPSWSAFLAKNYALQDNFSEFDSLMFKTLNSDTNEKSKEIFNSLKGVSTPNAIVKTYALISFDNEKSILIEYVETNEKYYIYDMINVPEEFNQLFHSQ